MSTPASGEVRGGKVEPPLSVENAKKENKVPEDRISTGRTSTRSDQEYARSADATRVYGTHAPPLP